MSNMVYQASEVMRHFSSDLADAFLSQPHNRVDLASAFAAGFVQNPEDDAPDFANAVLRAAYADREERRSGMEESND